MDANKSDPKDSSVEGRVSFSTRSGSYKTPGDQSSTRNPHAQGIRGKESIEETDTDVDLSDSEMESPGDAYRRRKAQLMAARDSSSTKHGRKSLLSSKGITINGNSTMSKQKEGLDSDFSSMSTSDDVEMDRLGSDGDNSDDDDEETGLTRKDRRKRKKRRRRMTDIDSRIGGGADSKQETKLADRKLLMKMVVNVLLIGSWYLFSLSISIYNTWMFSEKHLDFHFPLFTTCLHMLVQFVLASIVLFFVPRLRPKASSTPDQPPATLQDEVTQGPKKPIMTWMFYLTRCVPCGAATGLDIGLGNMSLRFITLTFYTMCKSSSLAFVLSFAFLFRLEKPSVRLILIITTMTIGVIMMVAGETEFQALGFVLVMSAAFFSGFRWSLTQILLLRSPATSNPFSSIFFLAPVMFLSLAVLAIPVEGFGELAAGLAKLKAMKGLLMGTCILFFPGLLAFLMTASEFALLQRTSVVTLSICGIFKEVVTISAGGIVFHDQLTPINISGLLITIASIAAYNYLKITKMREDARKATEESQKRVGASDTEDEEQEPMLGQDKLHDGHLTALAVEDNRPRSASMNSAKSSRDVE